MSGVFPSIANGGVTVRTAAGAAVAAPGVGNAFAPPAAFTITSSEELYGSDCTVVRWDPALHNAVVSELLNFAALLTPTGIWTVTSLANISTAFQAWMNGTASGTLGALAAGVFKDCTGTAMLPGTLVPTCAEMNAAIAAAISASTFCTLANTQAALVGGLGCAVSANAGNILKAGTDGKLVVPSSAFMAFAVAP